MFPGIIITYTCHVPFAGVNRVQNRSSIIKIDYFLNTINTKSSITSMKNIQMEKKTRDEPREHSEFP